MKNICRIACITLLLTACKGSMHKTGGAARDSSASHGYSGPADSNSQTGEGMGSGATTNGSSDTSRPNLADSTK